jgi:hypothetical protein
MYEEEEAIERFLEEELRRMAEEPVFFLFTYRKEESIEGFAEFRLNSPRIPD